MLKRTLKKGQLIIEVHLSNKIVDLYMELRLVRVNGITINIEFNYFHYELKMGF